MPYCEKCGQKISTDTKYCPNCGNPISKSLGIIDEQNEAYHLPQQFEGKVYKCPKI